LVQTWKRQMKFYGVAVVVGCVLLAVTLPQIIGGSMTPLLLVMSVFGGFGVLGGLFGIAVALFFHLWHHKGDHHGE